MGVLFKRSVYRRFILGCFDNILGTQDSSIITSQVAKWVLNTLVSLLMILSNIIDSRNFPVPIKSRRNNNCYLVDSFPLLWLILKV